MGASLQRRRAWQAGQIMLDIAAGNELVILSNDWGDLDPGAPTFMCRSCGRILPQCCFRAKGKGHGTVPRFEPDCHICEYERRKAYRIGHAFVVRSRAVIDHHYRIERKQGLHTCRSRTEYELLTGVTVAWLEGVMRHAYEGNARCHHCESVGRSAEWQVICPVIEDEIDLSRMTVDRTDPSRLLARDNLTLMCLTGNVAKNDTDPHTHAVRQAAWRRHNYTKRQAA